MGGMQMGGMQVGVMHGRHASGCDAWRRSHTCMHAAGDPNQRLSKQAVVKAGQDEAVHTVIGTFLSWSSVADTCLMVPGMHITQYTHLSPYTDERPRSKERRYDPKHGTQLALHAPALMPTEQERRVC